MPSDVLIRKALSSDISSMSAFIFEHGPNAWNFLPEKEVRAHIDDIATNKVEGVIAEDKEKLVGFITFRASTHLQRYRSPEQANQPHGYIAEAVTHKDYAGRGIGAQLLKQAIKSMFEKGFDEIYVERHEENPGSAGMMRKAGFVEVDTYDDPERRSSGSRRTTVCRIISGL